VVRSSQSREEVAAANDRGASGGVSVGNELPGAGEADGAAAAVENNTKSEEVVNYEISKRTRTEVQEAGRIKRLSVAVLVDGTYSQDGSNNLVYAARPPEQIEQITALVRSAMGFDRERGDSLEVVNLRFAPGIDTLEFGDDGGSFFELTKDDYFRLAEMAVLGIVALLVVFLIVRPLLRRALEPDEATRMIADLSGAGGAAGEGTAALPSPELAERLDSAERAGTSVTDLIDTARLTGQMQESSIRKVAELVKGNPDEAIGIIRQWAQDPA
jgi:flagellar M-ring protein FliF